MADYGTKMFFRKTLSFKVEKCNDVSRQKSIGLLNVKYGRISRIDLRVSGSLSWSQLICFHRNFCPLFLIQ